MKNFLTLIFAPILCLAIRNITWTPPPDMEDGVYSILFHENYEDSYPIIKRTGPLSFEEIVAFDKYDDENEDHGLAACGEQLALPISRKGCHELDTPLDPADQYASRQAMYNFCAGLRTTADHTIMLALKGTVYYYICNLGKIEDPVQCNLDEMKDAEAHFNKNCGNDKAAWITMKKRKKHYGRAHVAETLFCSNYL
ncbi:Fc.00g057800.m01.CDS01 [Cosmosporella sp. VM-42]